MKRRGRIGLVVMLATAAVLTATALGARSEAADPRKAAAALLRSAACHGCESSGASKIVRRDGRLWLAMVDAHSQEPGLIDNKRLRVYRWQGSRWLLETTVRWHGWGDARWISTPRLTASAKPDFAVEGCGAADTNCLSVVSAVRGRWHVVPFEYGYGRALVVNGVPAGHLVQTEVDACSCAGGPSTWLYERYAAGAFRPSRPPGRNPPCAPGALEAAAGEGTIPTFQFDRVACSAGWAIGVGTGTGYTGRVVGLFNRAYQGGKWRLLTVDNGTALPSVPAMYDLPRSLLTTLARRLGPSTKPQIGATALIARLQRRYGFIWPQQNGLVVARRTSWLVAVVPERRPRDPTSHYAVGAIIYRWSGDRWSVDGRMRHLPGGFDLAWTGGWFVSARSRAAGTVAFARAGSDDVMSQRTRSKRVITNAGGRWHVAIR
jgi:hypothetical protein